MAARDEQREVRKGRWLGLEQRGEQVSLQVVHADRRKPPGVREAAREGGAGEQCPDEPRAGRVGDPVQVLRLRARAFQCPSGQGQEPADMIARGELGHDAPIGAVQVHLAEELVREQARVRIQHRGGTLVTGRLKSQHPHEMTLSQLT